MDGRRNGRRDQVGGQGRVFVERAETACAPRFEIKGLDYVTGLLVRLICDGVVLENLFRRVGAKKLGESR